MPFSRVAAYKGPPSVHIRCIQPSNICFLRETEIACSGRVLATAHSGTTLTRPRPWRQPRRRSSLAVLSSNSMVVFSKAAHRRQPRRHIRHTPHPSRGAEPRRALRCARRHLHSCSHSTMEGATHVPSTLLRVTAVSGNHIDRAHASAMPDAPSRVSADMEANMEKLSDGHYLEVALCSSS